jgi:hypothetical protein
VSSWIGLIVLGIAKVTGLDWKIPRNRQLRFDYGGRSFNARFNHKVGPRGGIEIVEVLPGRGAPEGKAIVVIDSLSSAENFYNQAAKLF